MDTPFDTLINKKEDNLPLPDFNGIEIKTKLGYSKSPLTLFSLTPKKENDKTIKYIFETFGYLDKDKLKHLKQTFVLIKNKIIKNNLLKLLISNTNLNLINDNIYWNLNDIKYNKTYYKYNNLKIYKLKNFDKFIKLLEKQKIYITINIEYFKKDKRIGEIHDRVQHLEYPTIV